VLLRHQQVCQRKVCCTVLRLGEILQKTERYSWEFDLILTVAETPKEPEKKRPCGAVSVMGGMGGMLQMGGGVAMLKKKGSRPTRESKPPKEEKDEVPEWARVKLKKASK
jgi:hypothetical protein